MFAGVPGFPVPSFRYDRRWSGVTVEACEAVVRITDAMLPDGIELVIAWHGAHVQRFVRCPLCGSLRKALFDPDAGGWRCRKCARVEHTSRHAAVRDPLARVAALRERIGAPGFGTPLPPRPKGKNAARVYTRLAQRIAVAEAAALRHVRAMVRGIERHVERHARNAEAGVRRRDR